MTTSVYNREWRAWHIWQPCNHRTGSKKEKNLSQFPIQDLKQVSVQTRCVTIQLTYWVNQMNTSVSFFLFHYKKIISPKCNLTSYGIFQIGSSMLQVGLCIWACHKSITYNLRTNHYKSNHHIPPLLLYSYQHSQLHNEYGKKKS